MTVSLRLYTGTAAGTESGAETAIALLSVDAASDDPTAHKIAKGTNSFEKWIRLRIDNAAGASYSNFSLVRSGDLPTGVVIKMGVTDTPTTPTASTSAVATTTMVAGRRYVFDAGTYDTTGQHTRYVVLQEVVAATAASGNIPQQHFTAGWQQS